MPRHLRAWFVCLASVALSAESASCAQTAAVGSSQRLVVKALREGQSRWQADACLAGIRLLYNTWENNNGPGAQSGSVNVFSFNFWSPSAAECREVTTREAAGPKEPHNPFGGDSPFGQYEIEPARCAYGTSCLSELSVDSPQAVRIAVKDGLLSGAHDSYHLELAGALDPGSPYWGSLSLRRRTFWIVSPFLSLQKDRTGVRFIDAATGKILRRKPTRP